MKTKTIIILITFFGVILLVGGVLTAKIISFNNTEVEIRNRFEQKMTERTAFADKVYKVLPQKTQIALKNDESFREIVQMQVSGQANGENVMWAWVQQSNPAATFTEVTRLYQDLSRAIESERLGLFEQEKMIQDIEREHKNLIRPFPNNLFASMLGVEKFDYKPITAESTLKIIETGVDNNIDLGLGLKKDSLK